MIKSILKYAGKYKILTALATVMVVIAVAAQILPYIFAYQIISPLIAGESIPWQYAVGRVAGVAVCLVLNFVFYLGGLSLSHIAAFQHAVQSARELTGQNGEAAPRRGAGEGDGESEKAVRGRRGEYGTSARARHTRRHRQSAHPHRGIYRHVRGGLETCAINTYHASHRRVGGHDDDARRLCQNGQFTTARRRS